MQVQDAYNDWSATYDSDENLTRDLDQQVTRKALVCLKPRAILELGCGTGKNTPFLAQIGTNVYALDFSPGMIGKAQGKTPAGNAAFAIADLTKPWPYADSSADLVVCNLVLEHIEDLSFIFAEACRVLSPGGHFFVSELHPFKQYQGTKANFASDQGRMEIPAFTHHISDFLQAAKNNCFALTDLKEWWHERDQEKPPRLLSLMFKRR